LFKLLGTTLQVRITNRFQEKGVGANELHPRFASGWPAWPAFTQPHAQRMLDFSPKTLAA
jgi:hypothetical protein